MTTTTHDKTTFNLDGFCQRMSQTVTNQDETPISPETLKKRI